VATQLPADLTLTPLDGDGRTVSEWLTTFHLAPVVVDPYTNESAWILDTAARVLRTLSGADVRVCWLVAADADGARAFLGPLAEEFLTFADPDRVAIKGLKLERLPAFAFVMMDGSIAAVAQGWDPLQWREVAEKVAEATAWKAPLIPEPGDPRPYSGTTALT
jgi:hypothetical protein